MERPNNEEAAARLGAALLEAGERLQVKDGAEDCNCGMHFLPGPVVSRKWIKPARRHESADNLELRRSNNDVEYEEDSQSAEVMLAGQGIHIKVVGRIDLCGGKGPADLNGTRIRGCSFGNRTFMVASDTLTDCTLRGLVVAHEYGHNVCNEDTDVVGQVMFQYGATNPEKQREVTGEQCRKYIGRRDPCAGRQAGKGPAH